jgi:L-fuculose-phosphate aldolase
MPLDFTIGLMPQHVSLSSVGELRGQLAVYGRICYDRRLITSTDGNLSVRLDASHVLITPAGLCKGRLREHDIVMIDMRGGVVDGSTGGVASSETPMHLEVYRQRPDVNAVIHAHPVFATALSVAGMDFPTDVLPEGVALLGEVPTTAFAAPASSEDADAIRSLIERYDALLLRQHGALACGSDLESALNLLERIEHVAEVFHRAWALGNVERLSPGDQRRLRQPRDERASKG